MRGLAFSPDALRSSCLRAGTRFGQTFKYPNQLAQFLAHGAPSVAVIRALRAYTVVPSSYRGTGSAFSPYSSPPPSFLTPFLEDVRCEVHTGHRVCIADKGAWSG